MNNLPKYTITYTTNGGTITYPVGWGTVTFSMPLSEYERIDMAVEKMTDFPEVITIVNKLLQK